MDVYRVLDQGVCLYSVVFITFSGELITHADHSNDLDTNLAYLSYSRSKLTPNTLATV